MRKIALVLILMISLLPMAATHAQTTDPLVTVSIAESEVEPGETITVTWSASSHLRRFHHVSIELSGANVSGKKFTSTSRSGTMEITIPLDYYDIARVTVYPQKSNNQNYRDASNKFISASADVVVDDGVEIAKFEVTPNPVEQGGTVTVSWEVTYGDHPAPRLFLIHPSDEDFYGNEFGLAPVGSMTLTVPDYYTGAYFVTLSGEYIVGQSINVSVTCRYSEYYAEAGTCPMTRSNVSLTYQYFEEGLMIQWGNTIFVLTDSGVGYAYTQSVGDMSGIEVPAGVQLPDSVFSGTWLVFRDRVGFATGGTGTYSTTMETHPDFSGRHKATGYWFGGPNGDLIYTNPLQLMWKSY